MRATASAFHRLVAAALVALMLVWNVEAVVGPIRDGAVHHEDGRTALAHSSRGTNTHDHPEVPGSEDRSGSGQHQHGTAADHCTHHHGIGFPSSALALAVSDPSADPDASRDMPRVFVGSLTPPPPRA